MHQPGDRLELEMDEYWLVILFSLHITLSITVISLLKRFFRIQNKSREKNKKNEKTEKNANLILLPNQYRNIFYTDHDASQRYGLEEVQ
jgi:hypothetical protein